MSQSNEPKSTDVLDQETLQLLGSAPRPVEVPAERMRNLRARVMARIDAEQQQRPAESFVTVRAHEGTWIQIAPKIEKKVLQINAAAGTQSYLLRVQPGAQAPAHVHEYDELCLVLEGEVRFDDEWLAAGDYQFARKGSRHGIARSDQGAVLFIQTGLSGAGAALAL